MLKIFNKLRPFICLLCLLFIGFTDEHTRVSIHRQYQNLIPLLKTDPSKALPLIENLREQAEKELDFQDTILANILFSNGKIYLDKRENLKKALILNEKALDIRRNNLPSNHLKLAQSFHNTAMLLSAKGRYAVAKQYAVEAARIKGAQPQPDSASLMRSFFEVSVNNIHLGAYDDALEAATKTADLATGLKDTFYLANSHNTIGNVQLSLKNYEIAAEEYQVAYQFFSEDAKRHPSVLVQKNAAACLANLGVVMRFLNKNDQSLAYLNKAKNTYINLFASVKDSFLRVYAANCVFESGNTWAGTPFTNEQINRNTSQYEGKETVKNLAVALKYYDEALRLFGNIQSPYAVECWKARGTVLEKMNRGEEALQSYQNAIGVLLVKENNVLKTADVNDLIAPELLDAFAAKARILPKIHANSAGFHATFETLNKCDTLISRLMITYDADNSKYFLAEKAQPIYAQAIAIAYQLSQNTTIEKARFYQNAAFNFCEKNKAIVLLDNLKDQKAKHFGGIPDTLLAAECNLKADIAFAEKQLYDAPDSLKTTCKNAIFTAKQVFLNFQKQLEIDFPTYYNLKFQSQTPLSISDVQRQLDDKTLALEYFDDGHDGLVIFAFSKTDFKIFNQKYPPQYSTSKTTIFQQFRRSLTDEKFISDSANIAKLTYLKEGFELYKILLNEPLNFLIKYKNANINHLRIIPDGILGYIPFEMLLTDSSAVDWKGSKVPYVLRQYAVSYAYSAKLLDDTTRYDMSSFGGFGIEYDDVTLKNTAANVTLSRSIQEVKNNTITSKNNTITRGNTLSRLAFADDEVRNIGSLIGSKSLFLNVAATKSAFLENAPHYSVLHLAMHGAIDEENPLHSGLIFTKTNDSTDNYLSGYDLFSMQLHAKLVVLSSCNSGNGELKHGEGVMSLARAFAYAGCPSTVMSLWSIPDESTSKIMFTFYKYLKQGASKDVALQKAKLDYLENCPPQYQVPNYWGATVIIGNIAPVDFTVWWQKPLSIIAALMVSILGFVWWKIKYKNKLNV